MSRTIERSIEIDRSPEVVWQVLSDFPKYSDWNPFIRHIEGNLKVGGKLRVHISPNGKKGMKFRPTVTAAIAPSTFTWIGKLGVRGLFDGEHTFNLRDLGAGRTALTQGETFTGVLVRLFGGGLEATAEGFDQMNRALKERCESSLR